MSWHSRRQFDRRNEMNPNTYPWSQCDEETYNSSLPPEEQAVSESTVTEIRQLEDVAGEHDAIPLTDVQARKLLEEGRIRYCSYCAAMSGVTASYHPNADDWD